MTIPRNYFRRNLFYLLLFSTLLRGLLAFLFEFGNDEVYYWTYARYPALSHFDHPPMIGWLIEIFTLNLYFDHEFAIRLVSIVFGTINTFLIYKLGCKLLDQRTGWYAALLYTASVYCFLIAGVFVLPDTPQLLFWLIALNLLLTIQPWNDYAPANKRKLLLVGLVLGLGMLSKYTTAYLAGGIILYILLFNRKWLKVKELYLAMFISAVIFLPVVIWNFQNDFISFTFHGARVETGGHQLSFQSFVTEFFGEVLYSNPIVWAITAGALFFVLRKKQHRTNPKVQLLLFVSLPLIFTFLFISLFRATLPHWTGPGFVSLLPLAALWLREKQGYTGRLFPWGITAALLFLVLGLGVATVQIKTGFIHLDKPHTTLYEKGKNDFSLDLYGWRQLSDRFVEISAHDALNGKMPAHAPIISHRWFPAANFEYYLAKPTHRVVYAIGDLNAIHKYKWINKKHGELARGSQVYYITSSREFHDPKSLSGINPATEIATPEIIPIYRNNKIAYYFFLYRIVY